MPTFPTTHVTSYRQETVVIFMVVLLLQYSMIYMLNVKRVGISSTTVIAAHYLVVFPLLVFFYIRILRQIKKLKKDNSNKFVISAYNLHLIQPMEFLSLLRLLLAFLCTRNFSIHDFLLAKIKWGYIFSRSVLRFKFLWCNWLTSCSWTLTSQAKSDSLSISLCDGWIFQYVKLLY